MYQLAQYVLKIGSALAERVGRGEVGGCHSEGDSAWRLLQLAIVNARWGILPLSCTNRPKKCSFHLVGAPFDILGSFQSEGALSGQRALTIERLLMSGCGQGRELVKDMWKKLWLKFPGLTYSRSENTGEKGVTSLNKTSRRYNK